jgi:hypothetical protein
MRELLSARALIRQQRSSAVGTPCTGWRSMARAVHWLRDSRLAAAAASAHNH